MGRYKVDCCHVCCGFSKTYEVETRADAIKFAEIDHRRSDSTTLVTAGTLLPLGVISSKVPCPGLTMKITDLDKPLKWWQRVPF